jgi:hypothetical protein
VNDNCGPKLKPGTSLLCQDRDLGFQIVAHIMGHAYEGGPHDHGASWAIYGQAVRHTDMTEWTRIDDGSKNGFAKVYRLQPGDAGIFDNHKIHSMSYPSGARFIRVTGVDLSTINRARFNPKNNTVSLTRREIFFWLCLINFSQSDVLMVMLQVPLSNFFSSWEPDRVKPLHIIQKISEGANTIGLPNHMRV